MTRRRRYHIRLKPGTRRTVAGTLGFALLVIVVLVQHRSHHQPTRQPTSKNGIALAVQPLTQTFRASGFGEYRKQKDRLKAEVSSGMALGDMTAQSIAVYLFPELLEPGDFEKSVAEEGWHPLQQKIESHPNTAESRKEFEEMRAQIWIYENPDPQHPSLSDVADQVVHLYETMSEPK